MKTEILNAIYLIGMILLIASAVYYFIAKSKDKQKEKPEIRRTKTVKEILSKEFLLCGYRFTAFSFRVALNKFENYLTGKKLKLYFAYRTNGKVLMFIYLNEKNRLRKLKLYDSAG